MSSSSDWGGSETDSNPHSASSTPPAPLLEPAGGQEDAIPPLIDRVHGQATAEGATASAAQPLPTTSAGGGSGGAGKQAGSGAQAAEAAQQKPEPADQNYDLPDGIKSAAEEAAAISPPSAAADGQLQGTGVSPDTLLPEGEELDGGAAEAMAAALAIAAAFPDAAPELAVVAAMPMADDREQQELAWAPEQAPGEAAPAQLLEVAEPAQAMPPAAAPAFESMPEKAQQQACEQQAEPAPPCPPLKPAPAAADPSGSAGGLLALAAAAEAGSDSHSGDAASSAGSTSSTGHCSGSFGNQVTAAAHAASSAAEAGQVQAACGQHQQVEADDEEEDEEGEEEEEVATDAAAVVTVGSSGKQEQQQPQQKQLTLAAACPPPLATFPVQQLQVVLGSGLSNMRHRLQAGVERESALR